MANASAAPSVKSVVETSLSCLTQGITAEHNFEVINFSLLEGIGAVEFVNLRNFSVGGYDWNISLYPDRFTLVHNKDHVSAFLTPKGGGQEGVRVRFTFTVFGKDGKVWKKENTEHTFKSPLTGWGLHNLIHKSRLF